MARLEVHFPTGLVGYAGLSHDRPLLVGAHPQCDVVLAEPDVASVHCRIYWKRDAYWVEAAPGAEDVDLNGRRVRSAPLMSRDTLLFGETQIVIDAADDAEAVPSTTRKVHGDADATPYSDLWAAIDRGEAEELGPPLAPRASGGRWWSRFKRESLDKGETDAPPPGQEKLLRSPLILGLSGTLVVLAVTGLMFFLVFAQVGGRRHYDRALEAMREELYAEAVRRFDRFLEDYPDHELVEQAQVLRALSQVRRFSDGAAASPSQAVREAARMVEQVGHLTAFAPVKSQLGEILGRMARTLSAEAQSGADNEAYNRAQQAMRLLESFATQEEQEGQQLRHDLETAKTAIEKTDRLEQALLGMQRSIDAGEPLNAYRRRDRLVRRYPDLAAEDRLGDLLRRATELERGAITWQQGRPVQVPVPPRAHKDFQSASPIDAKWRFTPAQRARRTRPIALRPDADGVTARGAMRFTAVARPQEAALTVEPSDSITAQACFVVGSSDQANRLPRSDQAVVFAIAGGALYAVDAETGTILWRRVVGHDASFLPTLVAEGGRARALLADTRRNEVLLVEARTGELVWRQPLGGSFNAPPLLHQGRIFVATQGGYLIVMDAQTGRVQGHLIFPQPLAHAPVVGTDGKRLYVAAAYASLYVLSASSLECEGILYLGHAANGIRTNPLSVGEFLIVADNHTLNAGRLLVFDTSSADETGPVQEVALKGWVTQSPVDSGRFVWVATDAGTLYTFQISPARPSQPMALLAQSDHPEESGMEQYLVPWSELECFVAGAELRRYELSVQQESLATPWNQQRRGVPTQALQRLGDVLFAARAVNGAAGVLLTALDTRSNTRLWEIRLANGLAVVLVDRSAAPLIVVTQSGHAFRWTDQATQNTRVLSEPFLTIEEQWLDDPRELVCDPSRPACVLGTGDAGRQLLVWSTRDGRFEEAPHWIELPAAAAAAPAAVEQGILVPAADQRLYLLDANTGRQLAIPFQPPVDAHHLVRWSNPVVSQSRTIVVADTKGALFRLEWAHEPFDHLAAAQSRSFDHPIVSPLVGLHNRVYFVDAAHNLRAVSATDLSTVTEWPLSPEAPVAGPWRIGDYLVVESQGRETVCLDRNGDLLWRKPLEALNRVGPPSLHQGALCFVYTDGTVVAVRPQDAKELWRIDVHEPLAAGFVTPEQDFVVVSDDGTLNTLTLPVRAR